MRDDTRNWIAGAQYDLETAQDMFDKGGLQMAERAPELEGVIARYRDALSKLGVRVERIYLYGSYKGGTQREGSDIDLVVVSSDLERLGYIERLKVLGTAAGHILEPIEARGFTPREIADGDVPSFWKHVLEDEAVAV